MTAPNSVYKVVSIASVSKQLLADTMFIEDFAADWWASLDDHQRNGHIGPVHMPTRSQLYGVQKQIAQMEHLRSLAPKGLKPGTYRKATT